MLENLQFFLKIYSIKYLPLIDNVSGQEWGILKNWHHDCFERITGFAYQLLLGNILFFFNLSWKQCEINIFSHCTDEGLEAPVVQTSRSKVTLFFKV